VLKWPPTRTCMIGHLQEKPTTLDFSSSRKCCKLQSQRALAMNQSTEATNTACAQRTDREWTQGIMVLQRAAVLDSLTCLNTYRSLQMTQALVTCAACPRESHHDASHALPTHTRTNRAPALNSN
jgi:hypothetical protein